VSYTGATLRLKSVVLDLVVMVNSGMGVVSGWPRRRLGDVTWMSGWGLALGGGPGGLLGVGVLLSNLLRMRVGKKIFWQL
jgi:uncharacterized membrane protein YfcA